MTTPTDPPITRDTITVTYLNHLATMQHLHDTVDGPITELNETLTRFTDSFNAAWAAVQAAFTALTMAIESDRLPQ